MPDWTQFSGTRRRLDFRGSADGVRVYDDYAHHPTEIAATLRAMREVVGDGRLVVAFQAHHYYRTAMFMAEFGAALGLADEVVVLEVFAPGEEPIPGASGMSMAANVPLPAAHVVFEPSWSKVAAQLVGRVPARRHRDDARRRRHLVARAGGPRPAARTGVRRMTVLESAARFTETAAAPRRRRWWLVAVVLIAVLGGVAWLVGWSSLLSVKEVRVLGTRTLSTDQVRTAAAIALGTPLARVSAADVTSRVEGLPQVAAVEVRHGWPDVVVVVVTEREPVAIVADPAGFTLVDAGGTSFDVVARRPADLPMLAAQGDAATAALQVVTALPQQLRDRVVRVRAATADDVVLVLGNGTKVRWGSPTDVDLKAEVMLALLPRRAAMIDVSAPSLPTTRGTRTR